MIFFINLEGKIIIIDTKLQLQINKVKLYLRFGVWMVFFNLDEAGLAITFL